jgi:hypothetical protein
VTSARRAGSAARIATWVAGALTVAAGVSLVWPVNNTFLSGDCVPRRAADGSCPVAWDQVDVDSIGGAAVTTAVLLAFIALPLIRPRWYVRLVPLVPLVALGFLGVIIFGPIYVPAMLAMLVAVLLPDGARPEEGP